MRKRGRMDDPALDNALHLIRTLSSSHLDSSSHSVEHHLSVIGCVQCYVGAHSVEAIYSNDELKSALERFFNTSVRFVHEQCTLLNHAAVCFDHYKLVIYADIRRLLHAWRGLCFFDSTLRLAESLGSALLNKPDAMINLIRADCEFLTLLPTLMIEACISNLGEQTDEVGRYNLKRYQEYLVTFFSRVSCVYADLDNDILLDANFTAFVQAFKRLANAYFSGLISLIPSNCTDASQLNKPQKGVLHALIIFLNKAFSRQLKLNLILLHPGYAQHLDQVLNLVIQLTPQAKQSEVQRSIESLKSRLAYERLDDRDPLDLFMEQVMNDSIDYPVIELSSIKTDLFSQSDRISPDSVTISRTAKCATEKRRALSPGSVARGLFNGDPTRENIKETTGSVFLPQ